MSKSVWCHSEDRSAEQWIDACNTREQAIANGIGAYPGRVFFIVRADTPNPRGFFLDASGLLEDASERAEDECGECATDFPDVSDEAKRELDAMLSDWIAKYVTANFYVYDDRSIEEIDTLR